MLGVSQEVSLARAGAIAQYVNQVSDFNSTLRVSAFVRFPLSQVDSVQLK